MQKILILTPLDETNAYTSANIYKNLEKINALSVPMYADYLMQNKIASDEETSIIYALATAKEWATCASELVKDFVVIGNCSKSIKFDMIIGFNKTSLKLEADPDLRLQKMQEKYKNNEEISNILNDVYSPKDCEAFLIDSELTAKFVVEYLNGVKNGGKPEEQFRIVKEHYGRA